MIANSEKISTRRFPNGHLRFLASLVFFEKSVDLLLKKLSTEREIGKTERIKRPAPTGFKSMTS